MDDIEFDVDLSAGQIDAILAPRIGKEVSQFIYWDQQMDVKIADDFVVEETEAGVFVNYFGEEPMEALRYLVVTIESAVENVVEPSSTGRRTKSLNNTVKGSTGNCRRDIRRRHRLSDL